MSVFRTNLPQNSCSTKCTTPFHVVPTQEMGENGFYSKKVFFNLKITNMCFLRSHRNHIESAYDCEKLSLVIIVFLGFRWGKTLFCQKNGGQKKLKHPCSLKSAIRVTPCLPSRSRVFEWRRTCRTKIRTPTPDVPPCCTPPPRPELRSKGDVQQGGLW